MYDNLIKRSEQRPSTCLMQPHDISDLAKYDSWAYNTHTHTLKEMFFNNLKNLGLNIYPLLTADVTIKIIFP